MIIFLLNRSDQIDQLSFLFMFSMREIQSENVSSCSYDDDDDNDDDYLTLSLMIRNHHQIHHYHHHS